MAIHINQAGYAKELPKKAAYVGNATEFEICYPDGTAIYCGKISDISFDESSGDNVGTIDFSDFRENGRYYMCRL